jgi:hypothetical protein
VSFFEDETPPPQPQSSMGPARRRTARQKGKVRPPRRRNVRLQRLIIILVALFVIVFLLALWIRSCSHNRKVGSYQEYFASVDKSIAATNAVGQQLKTMVLNPNRYTREGISKLLDDMVREQEAVTDQVTKLQPPDKLKDVHPVLVQGMEVRTIGQRLWRDAIDSVLGTKASDVTGRSLAALGSYFTGPEAYYQALYYTQAQKIMAQEGVTNVTVPTAEYYTASELFTPLRMKSMLERINKSSSTKGIHGVALTSVTAQPGDKKLTAGGTTKITASTELSFVVAVENQGTVNEKNVPVTITLVPPKGENLAQQKLSGTIGAIKAGQSSTVKITGFNLDPALIGPDITLRVKAGPVPQEQVGSNNRATYTVVFKL